MRRDILAAAWVVAGLLGAQAAAAAVPAVECRNCTTEAHEEALALGIPGQGIRFVYNFRHHSIRKFKVYVDSGLPSGSFVTDGVPVEPQPVDGARVQTRSGTAVRTLYEMTVDSDMVVLFREMDAFNAAYADAWSGQFRIDINNLGLTNGDTGVVHFDPQRIGWDYPDGEGFRFMDRVSDLLGGINSSASVDGRLSRLIHGILRPATGISIEGGVDGAMAGVQLGSIGAEFTVDFCSSDGSCVIVRMTLTTNGLRSDYLGAFDKLDVSFPSLQSTLPIRRQWSGGGIENARSMARFIANRMGGTYSVEAGMTCNRVTMACIETGTSFICKVYCP